MPAYELCSSLIGNISGLRTLGYKEIDEPAINVWTKACWSIEKVLLLMLLIYIDQQILARHFIFKPLHPNIRGHGRACSLYQSWREVICQD